MSTIWVLNFCQGQGSYALCRFIRYSCICEAHMSPTLNGTSAIQRFKHSNAIEIRDGITFDFYTRLPHERVPALFTVTVNNIEVTVNTCTCTAAHVQLCLPLNMSLYKNPCISMLKLQHVHIAYIVRIINTCGSPG